MHEHFWMTLAEQRGAQLRDEAARGRRLREALAGDRGRQPRERRLVRRALGARA